jgi:hypothetical protein
MSSTSRGTNLGLTIQQANTRSGFFGRRSGSYSIRDTEKTNEHDQNDAMKRRKQTTSCYLPQRS